AAHRARRVAGLLRDQPAAQLPRPRLHLCAARTLRERDRAAARARAPLPARGGGEGRAGPLAARLQLFPALREPRDALDELLALAEHALPLGRRTLVQLGRRDAR